MVGMKTIKKILLGLFFAALFGPQTIYAQEITAINFNGVPLGKVIPDGKVVSFDNRLIGNVTADSLIVDSEGNIIGGVVPQGVAVGNDTKLLGKIGNDGLVRSPSGQVMGTALPTGLVVNDVYEVIGQILYPGLVYDDDGKIAGRITGDGHYSNLSGEQIGVVTPDGYAYRRVGGDYVLDGRLISSKMVVSLSGDFIGSVVPGGQVTDFDSNIIGKVKANGYVYNASDEIIGSIVNSGYAFDDKGGYIGFVSYNGEVVNKNRVVGKIRADGYILGISNNIIGKQVSFSATVNDSVGHYFGRLQPNGDVVRSSSPVGSVGPRGLVFGVEGASLGSISMTGPVYGFAGDLFGHAVSDGSVISLNGTSIGYVIGEYAYNLSGELVGKVLRPQIIYDVNNKFLGVSGISSSFADKGQKMSVSPYGFVFMQSGGIGGFAQDVEMFYGPTGIPVGYRSLKGYVANIQGNKIGEIISQNYVINDKKQLSGKGICNFYAVGPAGDSLGYVSGKNEILNSSLSPVAKILPDNSVTTITLDGQNYMPKLGVSDYRKIALDFKGNLLGYVNYEGRVNNLLGTEIGRVVERGLVVDGSGFVSGFVSGFDVVVDEKCEFIGVLNGKGGVFNPRNVYMGKLLANGAVINDNGVIIGYKVSACPVINFTGQISGYIDSLGKVNDIDGRFLGCINYKNRLYGADNSFLGSKVKDDSAIDFASNIIGYGNIKGQIINKKNNVVGSQQANGNVNSNIGMPLGMVMEYKLAFNFDGRLLGYIASDGSVIDNQKNNIGKVDFDGYIIKGNEQIGYALNDPYVYDEENKAVGYINKDGEVVSFSNQNLGRLDKGFLIKDGKVVARGNRDYNIRNEKKIIIGELQLNGDVIDNAGNNVGKLSSKGEVLNQQGNLIAIATPLQFYGFLTSKLKYGSQSSEKIIYDANGNKIGYIDENGNLVDENGNIIGRVDENGNIIDIDGNLIGKIMPDGNLVDENGNVIGKISDAAKEVVSKSSAPKKAYYIGDDNKVYDEKGNLIGRVNEKGEIVDDKGNVVGLVDKNGNIIDKLGKVVRKLIKKGMAYDINGNPLGMIGADGRVHNDKNEVIGVLNDKGEVVNANGNIIGGIGEGWLDKIVIKDDETPSSQSGSDGVLQSVKQVASQYFRSIGVALTSGGEYLGDVMSDDTVVNKKGKIVGYKMDEGFIVNDDGELIGVEEKKYEEAKSKGISYENLIKSSFSEEVAAPSKQKDSEIFIPQGSFGDGEAYGIGDKSKLNLGPGGGYGPGERYDPVRQAALEAAMQERRQNISVGRIRSTIRKEAFDAYQKDWSEQGIAKSISSWRVDMSEMIFSDKPIPAVIARAIDTNNPAPITAYVERNVYAEEGRNVIIPAGSRLIGAFGSITAASEGTSESARVQITWERLIRPDGSIFVFSGQTADAQGRAGALGFVDKQLFKKYSLPVLTTMLTSASSYFIASAEDAAGEVETSRQQAATDARENFLNDMESLFDEILADKTDIKAVTYIPAGTRIIIYPNSDLWLRTIERDEEENINLEKPTVFIDDKKNLAEIKENERKRVSQSAVVYDANEENIEPEEAKSTPFIDDNANKKKSSPTPPPPPPPPSGVGTTITQSPSSSQTSKSGDDSIPALF